MGQFDVVEFLNNNSSNNYTCDELSKVFNITRSSMSRLLTSCFRHNFVERKMSSVRFPTTYSYFAKV